MSATAINARHSPGPQAHLELTSTGRILLGMIAEGHRTGYAIKREIERTTRHFWGASIGGIYPGLKRLTEAGLVVREENPRGESRRHAYRLTGAGETVLGEWLTHPEENPVELRDEALLKLRFADVLAPEARAAVVLRMRERHETQAAELRDRLQAGLSDDLERLSVEYLLGWNEWALGWCDRVIARLTG